jgi:colicin import membrane protein
MAAALKIKSRKVVFRRAGFKFEAESETILRLDTLSKEQIEALKAEDNLMVSEIEVEDEDAKAKAEAKAKATEAAKAQAKAEADAKAQAAAEAKAKKEAEAKAKGNKA